MLEILEFLILLGLVIGIGVLFAIVNPEEMKQLSENRENRKKAARYKPTRWKGPMYYANKNERERNKK